MHRCGWVIGSGRGSEAGRAKKEAPVWQKGDFGRVCQTESRLVTGEAQQLPARGMSREDGSECYLRHEHLWPLHSLWWCDTSVSKYMELNRFIVTMCTEIKSREFIWMGKITPEQGKNNCIRKHCHKKNLNCNSILTRTNYTENIFRGLCLWMSSIYCRIYFCVFWANEDTCVQVCEDRPMWRHTDVHTTDLLWLQTNLFYHSFSVFFFDSCTILRNKFPLGHSFPIALILYPILFYY